MFQKFLEARRKVKRDEPKELMEYEVLILKPQELI